MNFLIVLIELNKRERNIPLMVTFHRSSEYLNNLLRISENLRWNTILMFLTENSNY